jgi:hypothetical protein
MSERIDRARWECIQPERQWQPTSAGDRFDLDAVAQLAVVLVLEPIFEADLEREQHAYRPNHNALDAVKEVHGHANTGHTDVVDADLSRYFEMAS